MPTRQEIQDEIIRAKSNSQDTIRRDYLRKIHEHTERDVIVYASGFLSKAQNIPHEAIIITLQDIQGFMSAQHELKGDKLDLILHSPGGSLEAADQIVQYLRARYSHIRAIVPQNAMSAATMICCACNEIIMGKHSAIGPIDPQVTIQTTKNNQVTVSAQSILDEFETAKKEIAADQTTIPLWANKIQNYAPGFLNTCQTTIDLAVEKVADWLGNYMFKGQKDGKVKASNIAEWLGNARQHKTHGRPIGISYAVAKGLCVKPLEEDQELQERVLSLFHATVVTLEITNCTKLIENHNGKGWYLQINPK